MVLERTTAFVGVNTFPSVFVQLGAVTKRIIIIAACRTYVVGFGTIVLLIRTCVIVRWSITSFAVIAITVVTITIGMGRATVIAGLCVVSITVDFLFVETLDLLVVLKNPSTQREDGLGLVFSGTCFLMSIVNPS
jgi:hypothetical protein